MTNERKRIERFCNIKAEAEFREAIQVMGIIGYKIDRMNGSHFVFKDDKGNKKTIPVHCNKIKKVYVKRIQKLIKLHYEKIQKI